MLRDRFQVSDLGDVFAQLLLDAHDDRHHGTGTAADGTAETHAGHAVHHVEYLDGGAVHLQSRPHFVRKDARDARLETLVVIRFGHDNRLAFLSITYLKRARSLNEMPSGMDCVLPPRVPRPVPRCPAATQGPYR